jgi:hypothetical protein
MTVQLGNIFFFEENGHTDLTNSFHILISSMNLKNNHQMILLSLIYCIVHLTMVLFLKEK